MSDRFIHIQPREVEQLVASGALLIDIREPDELDEVVPGAQFIPLSWLNSGYVPKFEKSDVIIYYCRSGRRTRINADTLYEVAAPATKLYIVEGGILAWKEQGVKLLTGSETPVLVSPSAIAA